jgi:hypothetical protein
MSLVVCCGRPVAYKGKISETGLRLTLVLSLYFIVHYPLIPVQGSHKKALVCQIWWHMPVILALGKLRQEGHDFKASLSYIGSAGQSEL